MYEVHQHMESIKDWVVGIMAGGDNAMFTKHRKVQKTHLNLLCKRLSLL